MTHMYGVNGGTPGTAELGRATPDELIAIWRELLTTSAVGPDDDFYDLGGHSLFMLRLLGRVAAVFGVEITLDDLFTHPTPARLADRIDVLRARQSPGDPA